MPHTRHSTQAGQKASPQRLIIGAQHKLVSVTSSLRQKQLISRNAFDLVPARRGSDDETKIADLRLPG